MLIFSSFVAASALQCYKCENCQGAPSSWEKSVCGSSGTSIPANNEWACLKLFYKDRVSYKDAESRKCVLAEKKNGKLTYNCPTTQGEPSSCPVCQTDLCNSGTRINFSLVAVATVILAIIAPKIFDKPGDLSEFPTCKAKKVYRCRNVKIQDIHWFHRHLYFTSDKNRTVLEGDTDITLSESSTVSVGSTSTTSISVFTSLRQPTVTQSMKKISSYSDGGPHNVKLTEAIVKFIVKDNMPFSIVEGKGFVSLMKQAAPLYKVPSRNTIKNHVDVKYESASTALKQILNNVQSITITTDTWTADMQTKSFLGITIHFICDLKLISCTIGVTELTESHTAAYIGSQLIEILNTWGINLEIVVAVVTDNAANIVKAVHDKFGKVKHVPCFAHTLNLLCENSIKNTQGLNDLIEKVRLIVVYFKRSVKATDLLRKIQRDAGTPEGKFKKKMILDVKTRWNSTYYMLNRFLELAPQISSIILLNAEAPVMLSGGELEQLKEIRRLLYPLEQMTIEISGQKYVTVSKIIPMAACLFERYENETQNLTYEIGKIIKRN
ncbi:unnamed protein product [Psylliodes chrysocephalus]|uniref:Uncharacterized protein n=1 Tax=Psylliodes chrysocephalus TaxID=3402493 RepID=A0A9P0CQP2_9CUCU|nr:unnamed protein product [Psylliodes chrysocephala]